MIHKLHEVSTHTLDHAIQVESMYAQHRTSGSKFTPERSLRNLYRARNYLESPNLFNKVRLGDFWPIDL